MSRSITLVAALFVVLVAYLLIRNHENNSNLPEQVNHVAQEQAAQEPPKFHEWREFSFKPDHFKVLLPALPQHVSDKIQDSKTKTRLKYETFASAGDNGAAFMVNAVSFPAEEPVNEEYLKALVNDMLARNKENKLLQMKKSTFHETPAFDFSFSNEDLLIEGKIFAHGNTSYILSMINKKNLFDRREWDFFLNSFDFVDDKQEDSLKK